MLKFEPLSEEKYRLAAPIMKAAGYISTECSYPALFLWSGLYNTKICIDGDTVYFRFGKEERPSYLLPFGNNLKKAVLNLIENVDSSKLSFSGVTEEMKDKIEAVLPGKFEYTERRASFDYIYDRTALATLSGDKLQRKRNHFNKFTKRYAGRFSYEPLSDENISEVLEFQREWVEMSIERGNDEAIRYESDAITRLLGKTSEWGLLGGVVRVDGAVRAYCVATHLRNDTVDVMVEKGDYSFEGIYQYINRMFASSLPEEVKYVNREDDAGVEGLRRSKLSYVPLILLKKYSATLKK